MERRYHIDDGNIMVEAPHTIEGKKRLEEIRKQKKSFKGRRIKDVIQAYPSTIKYYRVYKL